MSALKNLTGLRFGRLLVAEKARVKLTKSKNAEWSCLCDCGSTVTILSSNLIQGRSNSCGCWNKERTSDVNKTHGMSKTRLHTIWTNMKQRCNNPKWTDYHRYGGRGIKVCDEWQQSFEAFSAWASAAGYDDSLTIDRIDNDGNYEPGNCRWATNKEQARNKEKTKRYEGKTLAEWATIVGVKYETLWARIAVLNWPISKVFNTPTKGKAG